MMAARLATMPGLFATNDVLEYPGTSQGVNSVLTVCEAPQAMNVSPCVVEAAKLVTEEGTEAELGGTVVKVGR